MTADLRRIDRCTVCSAPILWAETPEGKKIAVDAEPVADGNVAIFAGAGAGKLLAFFRKVRGARPLHKSHFTTCTSGAP